MIKSRLEVGGVNFGFTQELPISTNMSIADIREPEKRQSTFSKTITVPGSGEVKRLFEFIFQVNSTLTSFNPNLKTEAKYYVNEVLVFDGALQLLKINNKYINDYESTTFECSLVGLNANLFTDIAGKYLTDLDFSDLDHTFSYASGLFNPSVLGEGYTYAYQDYGLNPSGQRLTDTWYFKYLKPLIFEKEYVNRIVKYAGYYWSGSNYVNNVGDVWVSDSYSITDGGYFDSAYESHIVIPDTKSGALQLASSDIADNECYVGRLGTYTGSVKVGSIPLGQNYFQFYATNETIEANIPYNSEVAPFFDPNARWDSITNYRFTVNQSGTYYIHGSISLSYNVVTYPTGAVTWGPGSNNYFGANIYKSSDGGGTWAYVGGGQGAISSTVIGVNTPKTVTFSGINQNVILAAGDLVRIELSQNGFTSFYFYDAGNNIVTTGGASIRVDIEEPSVFRAKMAFPDLEEGQTVRMNTTIPENVTQLDFLTSIIKLENLFFEPDKTYQNKYNVDVREDFFETDGDNALDWTSKWDISKPQEIIPMGELDWNKISFYYKQDQDYYNKRYLDKYKEVYGSEVQDVENDFVKKEKKIEVVFSATPIAGTSVNDIVAPRYLNMDETTWVVKPLKCNVRRLYFAGMKTCQAHTFVYNGTNNLVSEYPFVGHVDDPFNPTLDLCWDNPLELYWFFPGNTYTNNNRVNERWSKYIQEITDQNSKIVRQWFRLTETDISKFSFSNLVFVRDSYYYVNKIIDYNPQASAVTQVELLKLKAGTVFVPDNDLSYEDLGGSDDGSGSERTGNVQNGTGIIIGVGNYNNGSGTFIVGDDNVIG